MSRNKTLSGHVTCVLYLSLSSSGCSLLNWLCEKILKADVILNIGFQSSILPPQRGRVLKLVLFVFVCVLRIDDTVVAFGAW